MLRWNLTKREQTWTDMYKLVFNTYWVPPDFCLARCAKLLLSCVWSLLLQVSGAAVCWWDAVRQERGRRRLVLTCDLLAWWCCWKTRTKDKEKRKRRRRRRTEGERMEEEGKGVNIKTREKTWENGGEKGGRWAAVGRRIARREGRVAGSDKGSERGNATLI